MSSFASTADKTAHGRHSINAKCDQAPNDQLQNDDRGICTTVTFSCTAMW